MCGQRVYCVTLCDILQLPLRDFFYAFFFLWVRQLQGCKMDIKEWGHEWDWGTECETHKEPIKKFKKLYNAHN